jgi:hypothetical protein
MTACGGQAINVKREEMTTVITREELEEFIEGMIGGVKT